jgi:hypothetical protein
MYSLAALWRLFRGKKRNVLRQRTDCMEYNSMQLLVGIILFAVTLFLLTTIFVYHVFFTVLSVTAFLLSVVFLFPYQLLLFLPLGTLIMRKRRHGWFTNGVFLVEERERGNIVLVVTTHFLLSFKRYQNIVVDALSTPIRGVFFHSSESFSN